MAHPSLIRSLRDSGFLALESLRNGGAVRATGIGVNEWRYCSRPWTGVPGTRSCSPATIPFLQQAALDDEFHANLALMRQTIPARPWADLGLLHPKAPTLA